MFLSAQTFPPANVGIRQKLRDPGVQLWGVAALAWAALLIGGHQYHVLGLEGALSWKALLAVVLVLGGWLEMVAAMMLPTAIPMMRMFYRVSANAPRPVATRAMFLGGYLALWMGFALLCVIAALVFQAQAANAQWAWMVTYPTLPLAVSLAVAGVFQFSALKDSCLTRCRDPRSFLFTRYRRGLGNAWILGLKHGTSCLGCCWALMLVMLFAGLSNLAVMLLLAAVMVAEKNLSWGARIVKPLGMVLLSASALVLTFGVELSDWGLYRPLHEMCSTRLP